ncbi:MAG: glycosyltransferase [Myxococcales bacterium]|nr:glycosyltransferase [Myxococcales bacterium]
MSIEGILSHLGFSQVFRVIEGLSNRGLPYALVSIERQRDLEDKARLAEVEDRARKAGIHWRWGVYREGGSPAAVAENMGRLSAIATQQVLRHRSVLLHARAYHAGVVALGLQTTLARRWIFDARGYWIDERLEEGRWFTTPARLKVARAVERRLFSRASAVVTLTGLQADDVRRGDFGQPRGPVVVIPTCADFDEFHPRRPDELGRVPHEIIEQLKGRLVLGVVGSLNRAYLGRETARLAARVLARSPQAQVLVLTAQRKDWTQAFAAEGVPEDRLTITRVDHEAIPFWMNLMTWGVLLLTPETKAKTAMMPTKLAEFFASGVRVCVHGCNREVGEWVSRAGAGLVLDSVSDVALDAAADVLAAAPAGPNREARERARAHFSLATGLDRYEQLVRSLSG